MKVIPYKEILLFPFAFMFAATVGLIVIAVAKIGVVCEDLIEKNKDG